MKVNDPRLGIVEFDEKRKQVIVFDSMIKCMLEHQEQDSIKEIRETISPVSWIKEYCTMRFGLYRQAGHTEMINWFAETYSNIGVIVYKNTMFRNYKNIDVKMNYQTFSETISEIISDTTCQREIEYLFVDTASLFSKTKEDELYNLCTSLPNLKLIVFME